MASTRLVLDHRTAPAVTPAYRSGTLLRAADIGPAFYRFLAESSGRPGIWREREGLEDEDLAGVLSASLVTVLYLGGVPAGWFELVPQRYDAIRVAFAGVLPAFSGRGLERPLMAAALDAAWDEEPALVWAEVCEHDPPAMLLTLQWAGFAVPEPEEG